MSYGDFSAQIKARGAQAITRLGDEKATQFEFEGKQWRCVDAQRGAMTRELADGYEMRYCLELYCVAVPPPTP